MDAGTALTARLLRGAGVTLLMGPPVLLWPMLLPLLRPSSIPGVLATAWDTYLLFFGIPFALGMLCWFLVRRLERVA
ncbi:hypothetical protein [Sphingomonas sp. G-3-2-10]|uniref:hypothetical protein n=1 Tax=Sphingomonas sp. G-3-2-10 TaxID=2728838 RepID=UPI00146C9DC5|nr:hypothetical protein [Sphingomonas sp. G-3-2-10]NML06639.1 hypothetical protein [Sphingomonas sp. G-3-2-10]